MAWKPMGDPVVRKQRDKWVVRVDGIDTASGRHRPRQLGTYSSHRAALAAAQTAAVSEQRTARGTVGWLVRRYVESRTDVSIKTLSQYEWTIAHIEAGLGAVKIDRLDRDDITRWLADLAVSGTLARRSILVCRNVLRAALADAVDEGLLRRSPANRVPIPRDVKNVGRVKDTDAWSHEEVDIFLETTSTHRWAAGFRLAVLFGLRRSELLALRWDDVDVAQRRLRIDEGLVPVNGRVVWTNAKNARSRRVIPLDEETTSALRHHRIRQAEVRLAAGYRWEEQGLVFTTRTGSPALPRSFDRTLAVLVRRAELPWLTSHGLRHTAATHMVAEAKDLGELRAVADILGHSPEILLRIYAHALPATLQAVADRIGSRGMTASSQIAT